MTRCSLVLLLLPTIAPAAPVYFDPQVAVRDIARDLLDGKYVTVTPRLTADLRKKLPPDAMARIVDPLRVARSPLAAIEVNLSSARPDGSVTYNARAHWARGTNSIVQVTLVPDGLVSRLVVRDEPPPLDRYDNYQTKTAMSPPFRGTWTAHDAARDAQSKHFRNPNQRWAVDWMMEDDKRRTFKGDGRSNADYFSFGQDVLAPAAGKVVIVIDGIPDHGPGQEDTYFLPGNFISIDLGHGEFAMFAHLQQDSIEVEPGDVVEPGMLLGKVGNSGATSEPHLHFQLGTSPRINDCAALPAAFSDVILDGKRVARALPSEGSHVARAK
jgi:hypothetical protein